jgi:predicted nucleic acid-binding protein
LAAVQGLEEMLALDPGKLVVLVPEAEELQLAIRLQSRRPEDREWRRSLGARARRLDTGESASIAIATRRSLPFASDDEDALRRWRSITGTDGLRTRDLLWQCVRRGLVDRDEAESAYLLLQTDDLHNLGGPAW